MLIWKISSWLVYFSARIHSRVAAKTAILITLHKREDRESEKKAQRKYLKILLHYKLVQCLCALIFNCLCTMLYMLCVLTFTVNYLFSSGSTFSFPLLWLKSVSLLCCCFFLIQHVIVHSNNAYGFFAINIRKNLDQM